MSTMPISQVRKNLSQIVKPLFTSTFTKIYEAAMKGIDPSDVADIISTYSAETDQLLSEVISAPGVFEINNIYKSHNKLVVLGLFLRHHYCSNFLTSSKQDQRLTVPDNDRDFLHFMLFDYLETCR